MLLVRERPALATHIEAETPSGRFYRWAADEPRAENSPSSVRWSSTMPGGFETADAILARQSDRDFPDLVPFTILRHRSVTGEIVGEYRLERIPRVSGDRIAISPSAVGLQAVLEDDKSAYQVFADQDVRSWSEPTVEWKLALPTGTSDTEVRHDIGDGLIVCKLPNQELPAEVISEAWYRMPAGLTVARMEFTGTLYGFPAGWTQGLYVTDNANGASPDAAGGSFTTVPSATSITTPRRYLLHQVYSDGNIVTPIDGAYVRLQDVAVYGDHGLTLHAAPDGGPSGVLASDVAMYAVQTWAPSLTATSETVTPSAFVIQHIAFRERTTAGEIVRQSTRYGLEDWAVWEHGTFWWHPRNARGRNWRARIGPAQLEETGPSVDRLWGSIIVEYQDVDGTTKTTGPPGSGADTETTELVDSDPANPANQSGITRRDKLTMGVATAGSATEVGRRFLEEARRLDTSGRAQLTGYVEDDHGILHPYHHVRAGDRITFVDAADPSARRIVRAEHDAATHTCSVDLDAPPDGLAAILERLGASLVPLGL